MVSFIKVYWIVMWIYGYVMRNNSNIKLRFIFIIRFYYEFFELKFKKKNKWLLELICNGGLYCIRNNNFFGRNCRYWISCW